MVVALDMARSLAVDYANKMARARTLGAAVQMTRFFLMGSVL